MALTDNLISYWKLDGSSVDAVNDNDGTDTSVDYDAGYGKINQGARFNASGDYITIANNANISTSGAISIAMWVYSNGNYTGYNTMLAKRDTTTNYEVYLSITTGNIGFYNGATAVDSGVSITSNAWHYVVVTKATGTSAVKFYVDGSEVASTGSIAISSNSDPLLFGSLNGAEQFYGYLDEIGFWTRQITADEITTLYNSGTGLQYPFSTGNPGAFFQMF